MRSSDRVDELTGEDESTARYIIRLARTGEVCGINIIFKSLPEAIRDLRSPRCENANVFIFIVFISDNQII